MSDYYFVNQKGLVEKKEYDQSLCISYEKAVDLFQDVLNTLGINFSFSKVSGMSTCCEFNTDEPYFKHFYASIYQITPGGRSMVSGTLDAEKEFRIQIHAKEYNFIYEKKVNKEKACQFGVYDFYGTQMIVAWNPKQSTAAAETPISTQVSIDEIAQAVKYGFHQYMNRTGAYVCVFKKELIPFYLKNSEWLHEELVKNLPNHFAFSKPYAVSFIEKPKKKVSFKDYFKEDINFRYIKSLLAKPFVILTGNSGTGKTLISLDLAKYLEVPTYEHGYDGNCLFVNQKINEWTIKKITNETIYLTNETEPYRLRPIQKQLLQEFIDFYRDNPSFMDKTGNEDRSIIKDLPSAKFDKYLYGFDATIRILAKEIIKNNVSNNRTFNKKNILLIPVGADWTDNTKILGYFNPLANNGTGEYIKSEILNFIELAEDNPNIPFFLILDEMNLSHVERYFSDFLSAMESKEPILLYKKPEGCLCDVKESIVLPDNLFVTGTVNIDETTYMFSPKVLDRANVIEFNPDHKKVLSNFEEDLSHIEIAPANDGSAEGFLALAKEIRKATTLPEGSNKAVIILEGISDILTDSGFEFAYRTTKEIRHYLNVAQILAVNEGKNLDENDYVTLMDEQLLQKILPKIHGNRSQIGELLDKLRKFCNEETIEINDATITGFNLELSRKKIDRMIKQLETSQFASFI